MPGTEGRLVISNSTLALNIARCGDAYNPYVTGAVSRGSAHGGAIYAAGSNSVTQISFSTIAYNRADRPNDPTTNGTARGGGIYRAAGSVTIDNSILAENTFENVFGTVIDAGHNLISDRSIEQASPSTIQPTDAQIGFLGLYGGPTETVPLLPGSPAIDAAECSPATDQRGVSRPSGAGCDIGAFEARNDAHYLVVTTSPVPWTPLTVRAGTVRAFMGTNSYIVLGKFEPGRYEVTVEGQGVISPAQSVEITAQSPEVVQVQLDLQMSYTADVAVQETVLDSFTFQPVGSPIPFGHQVIYEFAVTNLGPGTARGLQLSNRFFGGQVVVGAGAATVSNGSVSTNLLDLEPFSSVVVRLTNSILLNATFVSNIVTIVSSEDPNLANNSASAHFRAGPILGDRVVQLTTASPEGWSPTVVVWDPATGKAFFGWSSHGLMSYDPSAAQFEEVTGFNLAPFGVVSLAMAPGGGLLYIGAGDRIIRFDTRTHASTSFNLEANFTSHLAVSPLDSNIVAVANDEFTSQIYHNGIRLTESYGYGGPLAFSQDGTENLPATESADLIFRPPM